MEYEDFLALVKKRRSIGNSKTDPIPDEFIEKIIEPIRYAPSGFSSQPWECVVVRKQALKERMAKFIGAGIKEVFQKMSPPQKRDGPPPPRLAMAYEKAPG